MNIDNLKKIPEPNFNNPPLAEVVVGVQFENPMSLRTLDVADIWTDLGKEDFPEYREMPVLDPILPENSRVFEISNRPPLPRYWFESPDSGSLIQIQRDRFLYNWRRPLNNMDDKNSYPRHNPVINNFFKHYSSFQGTLDKKDISPPKISFMELSYINIIELPKEGAIGANSIFKNLENLKKSSILPNPKNLQQHFIYDVPDLPLQLTSNLSTHQSAKDGTMLFQYELSIRGPVNDLLIKDMREWFNIARLWIIHGFVDTTTTKMHKEWEIVQC